MAQRKIESGGSGEKGARRTAAQPRRARTSGRACAAQAETPHVVARQGSPAPTKKRAAITATRLMQRSDSAHPLPARAAAAVRPAGLSPASCETPSGPASLAPRPANKRPSVRQRFGELRTALADGWEIVQPIFARPLWNVADDSETAFNFVLRRERATRLVTVPGGRTVQRFIREQQLIVDYRR